MTDKIIRLIVTSATSSINIQNLLNMQLLNSEYTNAYICIEKVIAYQNGVNNKSVYLKVSGIDECYSSDLSNTTIQLVDIFDGVINATNTGVNYSCYNSLETWIPIKLDRLNGLAFGFIGITNNINNADLNFSLSVKFKFVK